MPQTTYTWNGTTVTVADAERVVAFVTALPKTKQGLADYQWERDNPVSGQAFIAATIFASIRGLWPNNPTTDGAGNAMPSFFINTGSGVQWQY